MWLFRRASARPILRSRSAISPPEGYKTRFFSAADLVLMLEAAQRQGPLSRGDARGDQRVQAVGSL
jgi:hypothetical protein